MPGGCPAAGRRVGRRVGYRVNRSGRPGRCQVAADVDDVDSLYSMRDVWPVRDGCRAAELPVRSGSRRRADYGLSPGVGRGGFAARRRRRKTGVDTGGAYRRRYARFVYISPAKRR